MRITYVVSACSLAPCKGGVSHWVQIQPGNFASAGSNRSSHEVYACDQSPFCESVPLLFNDYSFVVDNRLHTAL